jgi:hypothetical protein
MNNKTNEEKQMKTLQLNEEQVKQLILVIDLMENTLEDLSNEDLEEMNIEINKELLFDLAKKLEEN